MSSALAMLIRTIHLALLVSGAVLVQSATSTSAFSVVGSTNPPPSDDAEPFGDPGLGAALLPADVLDIPDDWAIRDLWSGDSATEFDNVEFDPFLGLVECPTAPIRGGAAEEWRSRQFATTELPLTNGLLSIEVIVEAEDESAWADDREALDSCSGRELSTLTVNDTELRPTGSADSVPLTEIALLSAATADVPYPSAFDAAIARVGGYSATVILGGVDMGESYMPLVQEILILVLESLDVEAES